MGVESEKGVVGFVLALRILILLFFHLNLSILNIVQWHRACISDTDDFMNLRINSCAPTLKKGSCSQAFLYGMETNILIHLFKECAENFNAG